MFNLISNWNGSHTYSLAVLGLNKKVISKTFTSRHEADSYRHALAARHGLVLEKVWDDHHDKTYHYSDGVTFYIQRA